MNEINLPFNIEAEKELLGCVLLNPKAFAGLKVSASDFYLEKHREIWEAVQTLHADDKPADAVTVLDKFEDKDTKALIIGLANRQIGAYQAKAYAEVVREKSTLRQLIDIGHGLVGLVSDGGSSSEVIDETTTRLIEINQQQELDGFKNMKQVGLQWYDQIQANFDQETLGVKTGLIDIDNRLGGLRSGELIIIAGRPGTGKSALAGHFAKTAAKAGERVLVYSLEMSAASLFERMVSDAGNVDMGVIRNPKQMHDGDWNGIGRAASEIRELPISIYDKPVKIDRLCSLAKSEHLKKPVSMVMVDYLQLVDSDAKSREQEVAKVSRKLKGLSKHLECPVVALAQLNREVEKRVNKRPNMADLRDSGQIEQDADAILLLYRDQENAPHICEVLASKVRHGVIGRDCVRFDGAYQRFSDLHREDWPRIEGKEKAENVSQMSHMYRTSK